MIRRSIVLIAMALVCLTSARASDLCEFKPSATAQRIINMRGIFMAMRLFADTSQLHVQPLVLDENARSFSAVYGLDSINDTVSVKALVHPSGMVLDAKIKKHGRQEMSDCFAFQWASSIKLTPGTLFGKPVAAWRLLDAYVNYGPDSVVVRTSPDRVENAASMDSALHAYQEATPDRPFDTIVVDSPARVLHLDDPEYPSKASAKDHEGTVQIRVFVDANGVGSHAFVEKSCGFEELDKAALDLAPSGEYEPANYHGKRVSMWVSYTIRFEIHYY